MFPTFPARAENNLTLHSDCGVWGVGTKRIIISIHFVCHLTYEFHIFQAMAPRTRLARAVYIVFILQNVERWWKSSALGIGRWSKNVVKVRRDGYMKGQSGHLFWVRLNDLWLSNSFLLYLEDIFLLIMKSFAFLSVGATALVSQVTAHCKSGWRLWREEGDFNPDRFEKFGYAGVQYPVYQYVRMNTNYNSPIINLTSFDLRYVARTPIMHVY
jgi:hypothetical protein